MLAGKVGGFDSTACGKEAGGRLQTADGRWNADASHSFLALHGEPPCRTSNTGRPLQHRPSTHLGSLPARLCRLGSRLFGSSQRALSARLHTGGSRCGSFWRLLSRAQGGAGGKLGAVLQI